MNDLDDHYKKLNIEPIDASKAWLTNDEYIGFLKGNVIKYIARAGKKGPVLQDLRKAQFYLEKVIEALKEDQNIT